MSIVRVDGKPFELYDYTTELLSIPNEWGLIQQLGLFGQGKGVSQHSIEFDETTGTLTLLTDMPRGERAKYNKGERSKLHAVPIPHYNLDDAILPADIQGRRRIGTANELQTLADVRARKMIRMRKSWSATIEYARAQAIQGTVYAPNGTVSLNWYTEMDVTLKTVDFVLGTAGTEITEKCEEVVAHIQDNILDGSVVTDIIGLASPEFFAKLIKHAKVVNAYTYYSSTIEPLRKRLNSSLGGKYREFEHQGIRFIEYRGSYNGNRMIPAGECWFVPQGASDLFETFYGPAYKFALVNTLGEEQYYFEYDNGRDTEITIETESNFLNMVRRPGAVVKGHSSN